MTDQVKGEKTMTRAQRARYWLSVIDE